MNGGPYGDDPAPVPFPLAAPLPRPATRGEIDDEAPMPSPYPSFSRSEHRVDASLSILLFVQATSLFAAIPSGALIGSRVLLDACDLAFAVVAATVLTRNTALRCALLGGMAVMALASTADAWLPGGERLSAPAIRDVIALTAFTFNLIITALVTRHVFRPGRVTAHRIQGAVLLYLNVAALFAILFGVLENHVPGALALADGGALPARGGARSAAISYFSVATITTVGYGDIVPVHPLARGLVSLEAVFGQLFPATLLARLVGLHLNHSDPVADA